MRSRQPVSDPDLDFVSTGRLIAALARRSRACVMVVMRFQEPNEPNTYVFSSAEKTLSHKRALMDCLIDAARAQVAESFGEE